MSPANNPGSGLPDNWIPVEYECKCDKKVLVGCRAIYGPFAAGEYQHCLQDEVHALPGPIFGVWEEEGGAWVERKL